MTINNPFAQSGTCMCQYCSSKTYLYNNSGNRNRFCGNCGNKLDWPEASLTDWNDPERCLPTPNSNVIAKYDDDEYEEYYSTSGKWMSRDGSLYCRTPDVWRYD